MQIVVPPICVLLNVVACAVVTWRRSLLSRPFVVHCRRCMHLTVFAIGTGIIASLLELCLVNNKSRSEERDSLWVYYSSAVLT
jgi:hypothetical protein